MNDFNIDDFHSKSSIIKEPTTINHFLQKIHYV